MTDRSLIADKQQRYHKFFMDVAKLTANNSFARRTKVGAVLVKNGRLIASGWNGQPTGFPNCCEEECIGPDGVVTLKTLPTVIHAEANIISFCAKHGIATEGTELYITLSPCVNCALLIIQAGIKTVYFNQEYRDLAGVNMLKASGIVVRKIS